MTLEGFSGGLGDLIKVGEHVLALRAGEETFLIDWNPRQPAAVREHTVFVAAGRSLTGVDFAEFNSVVVDPPVDPPVAMADSYRISDPIAVTIGAPGVLANDSGNPSAMLVAVLVDGPTKGTVALNGDGSFTYTPGATFTGIDSFTYLAFNGQARSEVKQVSITEGLPGRSTGLK